MEYRDLTKEQKVLWRGISMNEGEDISPDAIINTISPVWTLTIAPSAPVTNLVRVNVVNANALSIEWGDALSDTSDNPSTFTGSGSAMIHSYPVSGTYKLKLTGDAAQVNFVNPEPIVTATTKIHGFASLSSLNSCFRDQTLLSSVPVGLFDNCANVKDFAGTFKNTQLRSIPAGLFTYSTKASSFSAVFEGCTNLRQAFDGNVFQYNVSGNDYSYAFHNCIGLTGNGWYTMIQQTTAVGHYLPHSTSGCLVGATALSGYGNIWNSATTGLTAWM